MSPIPLFVELCAGTAALSLRLAQPGARPPVSRLGSKQGYADAILRVLGLRPGQGARRFLWADPDPGCRLLHEGYLDVELRSDASEMVRRWAVRPPKPLWRSLMAEGAPRAHPASARELARWARIITANRLITVYFDGAAGRWLNGGDGGVTHGGAEFCTDPEALAAALALAPDMVGSTAPSAFAWVPQPEAICYIDPPYQGTTGYGNDLSREAVVDLALRWSEAGAVVCVSEAEALPELLDLGWCAREITWHKRGHSRSFSRQKREFLTMNVPGAHPGPPPRPLLSRKRRRGVL